MRRNWIWLTSDPGNESM